MATVSLIALVVVAIVDYIAVNKASEKNTGAQPGAVRERTRPQKF